MARCRLEAVRVHGDVPLAGDTRAHAAETGDRDLSERRERESERAAPKTRARRVRQLFALAPRHRPPRRRVGPVQGHGPERAAHVTEQRRDVHGLRERAVVSGGGRRGSRAAMTTTTTTTTPSIRAYTVSASLAVGVFVLIQIYPRGERDGEDGLVLVLLLRDVIGFRVPETPAPHLDAGALLLADDHLHHPLVPLHPEQLQPLLHLVRDLAAPRAAVVRVVLQTLQPALQNLRHDLLHLARAERLVERRHRHVRDPALHADARASRHGAPSRAEVRPPNGVRAVRAARRKARTRPRKRARTAARARPCASRCALRALVDPLLAHSFEKLTMSGEDV